MIALVSPTPSDSQETMIKLSVDKLTLLLDIPAMEYEGMIETFVACLSG